MRKLILAIALFAPIYAYGGDGCPMSGSDRQTTDRQSQEDTQDKSQDHSKQQNERNPASKSHDDDYLEKLMLRRLEIFSQPRWAKI